jgi:hypothetical protein
MLGFSKESGYMSLNDYCQFVNNDLHRDLCILSAGPGVSWKNQGETWG